MVVTQLSRTFVYNALPFVFLTTRTGVSSCEHYVAQQTLGVYVDSELTTMWWCSASTMSGVLFLVSLILMCTVVMGNDRAFEELMLRALRRKGILTGSGFRTEGTCDKNCTVSFPTMPD